MKRREILLSCKFTENSRESQILSEYARLARSLCKKPIAWISLVDDTALYFLASEGVKVRHPIKPISLCVHSLSARHVFVMEDASLDPRFSMCPLVISKPKIRFFVGVPLWVRGHAIGTLCIVDNEPGHLPTEQEEGLRTLGAAIEQIFENQLLKRDLAQTRETLIARENALAAASRWSTLGQITAHVGQEIKDPLSVIPILCEQLLDLLEGPGQNRSVATRELTSKICAMVRRINEVVCGISKIARAADGDFLQAVSATSLLRDALLLVQGRFRQLGVGLQVQSSPEGLILECRPGEVLQVLVNLLSNALDAVLGLKDRWVKLSLREVNNEIEISVEDSGPGISKNIVEKHLFKPFFTSKGLGKGTGIGLTISKKIMDGHKGTLELDASSSNTRFVCKFPKRAEIDARPH